MSKNTIDEDQKKEVQQDALQIAHSLRENFAAGGAYCQDIDTFRGIFRYVERGMNRSDRQAFIILFSLFPDSNELMSPVNCGSDMSQLGKSIKNNLRINDLYSRYSSSQYLVMLCDLNESDAEMIAERISDSFYKEGTENNVILHHCFPLKPTGK